MFQIYSGEVTAPKEGLNLVFSDDGNKYPWSKSKYLIITLENKEDHTLTLQMEFYKNKKGRECDFRIVFSILPKLVCTVPIDLACLDSQELILPRTKGRLRMMVYGKPLAREDISEARLTTLRCYKEQRIDIKQMYLSEEKPKLELKPKKYMDEMGQWIPKLWEGKIPSSQACVSMLLDLERKAKLQKPAYANKEWDQYGGWKKKSFGATGWFRIVRDEKRFWMADPEGNAFLSTGIDCINPGNDTPIHQVKELLSWLPSREEKVFEDAWDHEGNCFNYGIANLIRAFGYKKWKERFFEIARWYLYRWNMNTIANWTSLEFIRYAKMPYVLQLDGMGTQFPTTEKKIFRDFPDVFSEEYEENAKEYAKSILPFTKDPYMIGYFMRNEPTWGFVHNLLIAEELLASEGQTETRVLFIKKLEKKYSTIQTLNRAWKASFAGFEDLYKPIVQASAFSKIAKDDLEDFSAQMIRQYVKIPALEIRKLDPNHLNLGMRYAFITDPVMLAGHEFLDVFSVNLYKMNPYEEIQTLGEILDMPVMIGEFHFGALDRGLTSSGLRCVESQKERGKAYRYYIEQGLKSEYFLGAHYFQFSDQSCLGRFDGENYQIGVTDVALQEYSEMTEEMAVVNGDIYEIADGSRIALNEPARELPAVHC